jgi:hypothetical protein
MMNKLNITEHKIGKLEGLLSINTNPQSNPFCKAMIIDPKNICSKCYARRLVLFRRTLASALEKNTWLLAKWPMQCEMPVLNCRFVRLHSFGELINEPHLRNFYDIATANPHTTFSLITKRVDIISDCTYARPPNVIVTYGVPHIDEDIANIMIPPLFDHSYAVYSGGEPCGTKCVDCQKCYNKAVKRNIRQRLH